MRTLSSASKVATRRPLTKALSKRAGRSILSSSAVTEFAPPVAVAHRSGSFPNAASAPVTTAPRVTSRPEKSAVKLR